MFNFPSFRGRIRTTTEKESNINSSGTSTTTGKKMEVRRYGNRQNKCVRVVMVITYVLAVSFSAIMLALYYIFIWDPCSDRPDEPSSCYGTKNSTNVGTKMSSVVVSSNVNSTATESHFQNL